MKPSSENEELLKRFTPIVRQYHAAQQKMVRQRKGMQDLLAATKDQIKALEATPDRPEQILRYVTLQQQGLELGLQQFEAFALDTSNVTGMPQTHTPGYKLRAVQQELVSFQLEQIIWTAFAADLHRDLPGLRAGAEPEAEPPEPAADLPEAWLELRGSLAEQPQELETWQQFADEVAPYSSALDRFLAAADVSKLSPQAALQTYEDLKLPALRGTRFRVESFARRTPGGLELLKKLTAHYIPFTSPLPVDRPAAATPQRPKTDRLSNFFRSGNRT